MKEPKGFVGSWWTAGTRRGTWTCAATGLSSIAFGLSVAVLLIQISQTGPMVANAVGIVCLSLSLRFFFAARLNISRMMDLALVVLIAFVANALILAVLLHSAGASPFVAQLVAISTFVGLALPLCELFVLSDLGSELLHRFVVPLAERPDLVRLGFLAALAPSLAYIAARTVMLDYNANDFRYYWLAGDLGGRG